MKLACARAPGAQHVQARPLKVQIKAVPGPVCRHTFKGLGAARHQIVQQQTRRSFTCSQPQAKALQTMGVNHPPLRIEHQLYARIGSPLQAWGFGRLLAEAAEQAPEESFTVNQNFILDVTVKELGRSGTVIVPNLSTGMMLRNATDGRLTVAVSTPLVAS